MRKIIKYHMIATDSVIDANKKVNEFISEGWEVSPTNDIASVHNSYFRFNQLMVMYEKMKWGNHIDL